MTQRWRLVVRLLPLVIAVGAVKVVVDLLELDDTAFSPLYTGLVAGTIFLLAFLLSGTLADYKESERLPGELAASLATIADECAILRADKGLPVANECMGHLHRIATSIDAWLRNREERTAVFDGVTELNRFFLAFEPHTQPNFIVRLKQEQSAIRKSIIRIATIRDTSFVRAGYTVAEVTSVLLVAGLLFTRIGDLGMEVFLVCSLAFLLGYVLLLIKDLDNPFDYDGATKAGAAEVSLRALTDAIETLKQQHESTA